MSEEKTANEVITEEVTSWPGVEAGYGRRGEWGFRVTGREDGHLHGDHAAHFSFGKEGGAALRQQGRGLGHPVLPRQDAVAARLNDDDEDHQHRNQLMRPNYNPQGAPDRRRR